MQRYKLFLAVNTARQGKHIIYSNPSVNLNDIELLTLDEKAKFLEEYIQVPFGLPNPTERAQ